MSSNAEFGSRVTSTGTKIKNEELTLCTRHEVYVEREEQSRTKRHRKRDWKEHAEQRPWSPNEHRPHPQLQRQAKVREKHAASAVGRAEAYPQEKAHEIPIVVESHAIVDPWAVVVHVEHAGAAHAAVVAPGRLEAVAHAAKLPLEARRYAARMRPRRDVQHVRGCFGRARLSENARDVIE